MTALLTLAALGLAAPVGYLGLRAPRPEGAAPDALGEPGLRQSLNPALPPLAPQVAWRRRVLWAFCAVALLAAPWALPQVPVLRFFASVWCVLAFMRLTETWLGKVAWANTRRFGDYFWYFTFVGEIRHHPPEERSWGRAMGARRVVRGLLKGASLAALFALSTGFPQLWDVFVLRTVWCLWAGYLGATGGADLCSGIQMVVSGHGCNETFVVPPLARSPSDFWGRRWNLVFRNVSYRVLFQRLARRYGVSSAGAAVFLWSIVAHEYLVIASLGHTRGHMTLFFGLQGVMTLLLSRTRRGQPWPTYMAVGAHWLWMIATAPLFFSPVLEIFQVQDWRLW